MFDSCKKISYERVTASKKITEEPLILIGFVLSGGGDIDGKIEVYDTFDTNGDVIITMYPVSEAAKPIKMPQPVYLRKGLYIAVTDTIGTLLVQYIELGGDA